MLRRRVLRGESSPSDGQFLLAAGTPFIDHRYAMTGALAGAAWSLRDNFTFYDALYVALAQALSCPLLTADEKLSQAPTLPCSVELVVAT